MNPRNLLLTHLPREVYDRIKPDLKLVKLSNGEVVHRPGETIRHLYFPETCMISITVRTADGRTVETGAIGSREVVGINAFRWTRDN
jgi:CRP-like cAMP-binding protein